MIDQNSSAKIPAKTARAADRQQWAALPEAAATWRLLDVLDRLEAFHVNLGASVGRPVPTATASSPGKAITAELNKLRTENSRLRQTQRLAIQRLDDLLTQIPALENARATEEETAPGSTASGDTTINLRLLAGQAA